MFDKNPLRVQVAPKSCQATPLVLLHDGGGTTFAYFSLETLNRDVWAIHNPKYYSAESFEGGMDDMARLYIRLMEEAGISGGIILGGWSLGGYLSLAIARILAQDLDSRISVAGLLMIDSPYHIRYSALPEDQDDGDPDLGGLPDLVREAFADCDVMLQDWDLPSWDDAACEGKDAHVKAGDGDFTLHNGDSIHKPIKGDWRIVRATKTQTVQSTSKPIGVGPPPAVLLKCTHKVPAKGNPDARCSIDFYRDELMLGFGGRHPDFIKAVIDVDADHYNLFAFTRIKHVTDVVNQGLGILESMELVQQSSAAVV